MSENETKQVDGTLMPPDGPESWPKADSPRQWLVFYRLDQMTLTGSGTIEGNGQKWWELPCKPHRVPTFAFIFTSSFPLLLNVSPIFNPRLKISFFRVQMGQLSQDHVTALQ